MWSSAWRTHSSQFERQLIAENRTKSIDDMRKRHMAELDGLEESFDSHLDTLAKQILAKQEKLEGLEREAVDKGVVLEEEGGEEEHED